MNILCRKLSLDVPIFQGGMGNISHAQLTGAISAAGALGTIGAGTMKPQELEKIILEVKKMTDKPFCLNIPIAVQPYLNEIFELVFKHHIPVVSLSAGNPKPFIPTFQASGVKVICVVASVKQAIKAESAGADVLVAEGYEAAGINSNDETTTLTLIPQIVKAVKIPVVAAGGIADGSGFLAMLALGAEGVQMGTRFIATKEAMVHDEYKQSILRADDTATVIVGRSIGRVRRILKNDYAKKLLELEKSGTTADVFNHYTDETRHIVGAIKGKLEEGHVNSGQIAGLIDDLPSVSVLINRMMKEARSINEVLHKKLS
ncbi:NAD(P)H-dependent flavin oxidoreductase [Halalkalibacterium ligniniphilum]|uniref:NAD(P)H-dependent flavin oxidoreductase n=1 Tax=Halalkalibacterium ligniniphilum TaxID=1134413 RepID=UPI00034BE8DE|nr:nitronate monooxygenase [Halalkalibacterium ligniniphilum]